MRVFVGLPAAAGTPILQLSESHKFLSFSPVSRQLFPRAGPDNKVAGIVADAFKLSVKGQSLRKLKRTINRF